MIALNQAINSVVSADSSFQTLAPGGLWYGRAPQGTAFPYVIFNMQSDEVHYTWTKLVEDNFVLLFRAYAKDTAATDGRTLAGQALERVDTILTDAGLAITGKKLLYCRRERELEIPSENDPETNEAIYAPGALYRIRVANP